MKLNHLTYGIQEITREDFLAKVNADILPPASFRLHLVMDTLALG